MRRTLCAVILLTALAGCTGTGSSETPGAIPTTTPDGGTNPGVTPSAPAGVATSNVASAAPAATIGMGATVNPAPESTPRATGTPIPKPTANVTTATIEQPDLRYRLVDQLGRPLFCDPDLYPVARADEGLLAAAQLPAIRADASLYAAIASHLGINPSAAPTDAQTLAIYRDWKMLRAIVLAPLDGRFGFNYVAAGSVAGAAWHVAGTVSTDGTISISQRNPSGPPPCPICLVRGTLIATPDGQRPVEDLVPGTVVWTTDLAGRRIPGRVLETGSTPVPTTHLVVDLVLSDGRAVEASPGHPLPDGRRLGDLRPGDPVDGALVVSATLIPYAGGATFDLLPSGPTGTYWADGIPLASTLAAS